VIGNVVVKGWRLVVVESPYAGTPEEIERNTRYARACMRDCLVRGDAPIASHLLYTQAGVLRDEVPEERALGIEAGLLWARSADASIVYVDLGLSRGMRQGIERAVIEDRLVETLCLTEDVLEAAVGASEYARLRRERVRETTYREVHDYVRALLDVRRPR
jgi:hypothetical protein